MDETPQNNVPHPDWRWGTPEGSREFDRMVDRSMTFRERLEWLEEAETLALRLAPGAGPRVGEKSAGH